MKKTIWIFLLGIVAGFVIIALVALPRLRPYTFHGTVLQSPQPAPDFELTASHGQKISLKDFEGKIVMLYFGYTFCPDVCPATLFELRSALELLGQQADEVQTIMISVDPERDTPEMLAEYVAHFHPSFIGVTGSPEEIAEVATLYGIFYEAHEGTAATGYLVDHTATVMVIDQSGHLKLVFPFGEPAENIAEDLSHILN
jgi:protein SCO1/2